jgi:hypothetical protein
MPRPIMFHGHLLWFDHKALYASLFSVVSGVIAYITEGPIHDAAVIGILGGIVTSVCSFGLTIFKLWVAQRDKEAEAAERRDKEKWARHGILNKLEATTRQVEVLKVERQYADRERADLRTDLARHQGWIEKMIERYPDMPPPPPAVSRETKQLTESGQYPAAKPNEET